MALGSGDQPTERQREQLAKWPGWGPLAPAFDPHPEGTWDQINERLTDLLTVEELTSAGRCVDNSFYTSPLVTETVWAILRDAGFTGGRVLEPGCGSGNFLAAVPDDMPCDFVGVEKDIVSARIGALLHPDADVIEGAFEKVSLRGKFDAAVGNVPFSNAVIYDAASGISCSTHNYFIRRSLTLLREGGYLVMVTSRWSVDSVGGILGSGGVEGEDRADFVGAMRLPSGAFHDQGTDVVTDVVVFRKRAADAPRQGWQPPTPPVVERDWRGMPIVSTAAGSDLPGLYSDFIKGRVTNPEGQVHRYWWEHPSHVAGEIVRTGNFRNPIAVKSDDPGTSIAAARDALAAKVRELPIVPAVSAVDAPDFDDVADEEGRKEGSFHVVDGVMHRVQNGTLVQAKRAPRELFALVEMRDLALELLEAEADETADDDSMDGLRSRVRAKYEAYVRKNGPLNRGTLQVGAVNPDTGTPELTWRRPTLGGFRADPDYVLVMALEKYDQDSGNAEPAAILLGRVNRPREKVSSADSPDEALTITLGECGWLDLERVAALLGLASEEEAFDALGDRVYRNPQTKQPERAVNYLSGNVREKHKAAVAAAETNPDYARNVDALAEVLPVTLGPEQIRVRFGNPCVTAADVEEFLREVVGGSVRVSECAVTGTWEVTAHGAAPKATTMWGLPEMNAYTLTAKALNSRSPIVTDEVFDPAAGRWKKQKNPTKTLAAQEKTNMLQERFGTWVWEDPDRSRRICADYNTRFNSHVPRVSDGSYLSFPDMSDVFDPHPWQVNMVDQALSTDAVLCGHSVGAGKTLTMAMLAMSLRRFRLARKPMIVVPNHLLEQIAREAQQAFPTGKFLMVTKDDLTKDRRRLFAARCATGDWDAVVITHNGFTSLPVSDETNEAWIERQKSELESQMRGEHNYFGSKEISKKVQSLEAKLGKARTNANTDTEQVLFEHLGVDYIMVDEAHYMKRLATGSRMDGFSMGSSKRATDLLVKSEYLMDKRPGQPRLGLFTGTPWTNSLAETWVWQRFLQPEELKRAGVDDFDTWSTVFVKRETVVEVAPDGSGFRTATRPTEMINLHDVKMMLGQVSDVMTADDLGLERPSHTLESIGVEPTDVQKRYVKYLVARGEALGSGEEVRHPEFRRLNPSTEDIMLSICGDGRRVALDPYLVGVNGESPKIKECVARTVGHYHATEGQRYPGSDRLGALQVIFCDQGTPNKDKGGQTYGRLRDALVEAGIPAEKVRMIHDAKDDKARAGLFAACRDGSVAVLIGSTEKMGTGTNIQTRLSTVHHLDAPWRPSDIEQRNGRALRPKNLNSHVQILRYATEGTFDAYMWQTLERKQIGFAAMYSKDPNLREVDDIGEVAPDFTQMKALATGSPLMLEQAKLVSEVKRLRTLRAVDRQSLVSAQKEKEKAQRLRESLTGRLEALREWLSTVDESEEYPGTFQRLAHDSKREERYGYGSPSAPWFPDAALRLNLDTETLEVKGPRFRVLDAISLHSKMGAIVKGSEERVANTLERFGRAWFDRRDELVPNIERRVEELDRTIAEATQIIDTYRFDKEDELDAAAARLSEIEAEMAEQATVERGEMKGDADDEWAA